MEADGTAVLIDCGLSGKELKRRLVLAGLDVSRLGAIIVSHEHRDHAAGAGILARMFHKPVYLNERTFSVCGQALGKVDMKLFRTGEDLKFNGLTVQSFSVSHDAADTIGFTFFHQSVKLGLATDLGVATALVRERLTKCNGLILESNHDLDMLHDGPYPWHLKQRVHSRQGHLSNEQSADLLAGLLHSGLKSVILAHLSETNNLPELALETAGSVLKDRPECRLQAASQNQPCGPVDLD